MKRILVLALAVMMLIAVSALAEAHGEVTLEQAKQIALDRAGVKAEDAVFTQAHHDHEDGRAVFEIEFYVGTTEYDMDIDIVTGEVLDFETEEHGLIESDGNITLDAAKQIALAKVGVKAEDVKFTKAHLDTDDGRKVYEVEFVVNGLEYEFDIDAASGAILEFDAEFKD